MQGTFWSHTVWYFLLAIVTIVLIVVLFIKSNNRKFTIGFSFAVLGLTFFAETGLLTLLDGYRYFPKLSSDPFLDSIIGNYFSQLSLTVTALLVSTLQPPKIWYFIIAAAYCFIEIAFIKLGIFQHKWYQTWYTFVLVLLLLWISNIWYQYMIHFPKKPIYNFTLFLGASAVFSLSVVFISYVFSLQIFNIVVFQNDFFRNQAVLIVSYRTITTLLMTILHRLNLKWGWKGACFIFLFLMNYMLVRLGISIYKDGLFWILTLVNIIGAYFWVVVIDYLLKKGSVGITNKNA